MKNSDNYGNTEPAGNNTGNSSDATLLLVHKIQLLLSEKRTSLSVLRTGIAVFAVPISVLSVLIATSRYYSPEKVLQFLIPVLILCLVMTILALYLIIRALKRLHHFDKLINDLNKTSADIAGLMT
ncbi:MAG: hypothetical protein NTW49_11060 [Bacteroidia bacterium]|nr:hypothetical protein [Bacteroidia bacterium]